MVPTAFVDDDEPLQVSPNADLGTTRSVIRHLVKTCRPERGDTSGM